MFFHHLDALDTLLGAILVEGVDEDTVRRTGVIQHCWRREYAGGNAGLGPEQINH